MHIFCCVLSGERAYCFCVLLMLMTGGQTALALRLLLALFSSKISSDVNRPFGDEVVEFI